MTGEARARLRDLLRGRAVLHGDFILSSGQRSSYYLDARLVTLSADGAPLVGQVFLELLRGKEVDAVAGPTVAADPIVAAVTTLSAAFARPIDGLLVRKEAKAHGAGRRIEGPFREGMRVAVLDDTLTTGASLLDAAEAISRAGGAIEGIYALIDRQQGGRQAIEAAGYTFQPVFELSDLL